MSTPVCNAFADFLRCFQILRVHLQGAVRFLSIFPNSSPLANHFWPPKTLRMPAQKKKLLAWPVFWEVKNDLQGLKNHTFSIGGHVDSILQRVSRFFFRFFQMPCVHLQGAVRFLSIFPNSSPLANHVWSPKTLRMPAKKKKLLAWPVFGDVKIAVEGLKIS